ncbi:DNA-binding MarR family transcriptional regulator [Actinomadura hallensis]|uniref:DNA-binding MarR family transcriptional regulator n=1 Tax=Actinomadura hallensis TaxID=337895 RepID=A0A543IBW0_9ACTN|nr:MarR family transcriptional regulator [Actinomadura hallensis]TQM68064.1 DNA-binding MarR family transcriptional regulator [Actinomadura hallensis]
MTPDGTATGRLLWQVTTRWRAAVDRAVAPLGLTHAQYVLLGSLYGLSRSGARPSQRELADFAGLEPIYVSKLVRALESAGMLVRSEHPADPRAFQLDLTEKGTAVIREAVTVVHALQDELTAPIGGSAGVRNRELVRTLQALLDSSDGSEDMTGTPVLTGQDISEAHGAVRKLHERILHGSGTTSNEQITLRVIAVRGPWSSRTALRDHLAGQRQLGLDEPAADRLLDDLRRRGLITADAPVTLTAQGEELHSRLAAKVQGTAAQLYDGLSPEDLAVAQRVLTQIKERADDLSREL